MTLRDYTEQDIHLALDGEMPAEDRAGFDVWLERHPEMQTRSERFAADRRRLQVVFGPAAEEAVPERFARLLGAAPRPVPPLPWKQFAAAILLVAAGIAGGYMVGTSRQPVEARDRAFADNAIQAHDIYAAEKLHVVEVKADQREHLMNWLSKRVGLPLVAPDLTGEGYELIGGRLLPDGGRPAAQFMYQDAAGERISLYVARETDGAETGFRSLAEGDTRAYYWMDDGYGCAIAGAAPPQTLQVLADAAYRQLLAAGKR